MFVCDAEGEGFGGDWGEYLIDIKFYGTYSLIVRQAHAIELWMTGQISMFCFSMALSA